MPMVSHPLKPAHMRLTLRPVNAGVFGVHGPGGVHLGNLKQVGMVWKFKAVGYDATGAVEPGGGPLTGAHNTAFAEPEETEVNARLAPHIETGGRI